MPTFRGQAGALDLAASLLSISVILPADLPRVFCVQERERLEESPLLALAEMLPKPWTFFSRNIPYAASQTLAVAQPILLLPHSCCKDSFRIISTASAWGYLREVVSDRCDYFMA